MTRRSSTRERTCGYCMTGQRVFRRELRSSTPAEGWCGRCPGLLVEAQEGRLVPVTDDEGKVTGEKLVGQRDEIYCSCDHPAGQCEPLLSAEPEWIEGVRQLIRDRLELEDGAEVSVKTARKGDQKDAETMRWLKLREGGEPFTREQFGIETELPIGRLVKAMEAHKGWWVKAGRGKYRWLGEPEPEGA